MSDRTAAEVKEYVEYLEHNVDHMLMREMAKDRHDLVNMLKTPELPEHMTRGMGSAEPTPLLIWLAGNIAADVLPYPTTESVTPFGTTQDMQAKADKLEKWSSLWRSRADEGRRVSSDVMDNLLLSPYAIMQLICGDPDEDYPWLVTTPDPSTCFFAIERAPFRPKVFGRRYIQTVREAERAYSGRKNYYDGSWSHRSGKLGRKDGVWGFDDKLGTDRVVGETSSSASGGPFEDCEFLELHDGEMCYHLALNKGGKDGEIVWQGKSMTGGVSAVVMSGHYSSVGPVAERMQPVLWPPMQLVYLINRVRAKRANRSDNLKPDMVIEQSPEMLTAQAAAGTIAQGQQAAMEAGGPNIINVRGRAIPWELQDDPDLDKQEQSYWTELNRYINAMTEVSDAEIVKDATANAFLTNLESRKRQRAPMLAARDWGWNEIVKMAIHSLGEYDKDFELYSITGEEHKDIKKGQGEKITKADADFAYYIQTETRSTTEAEARMRVQDWAYRHELGLSSQSEGVTAAGYTDETAQLEALAVDLGKQAVTPWVGEMIKVTAIERVRLRTGIDISAIGGAPTPMQGQPPGGAATGGGPQPLRPAAIPGPAGGSGQAIA